MHVNSMHSCTSVCSVHVDNNIMHVGQLCMHVDSMNVSQLCMHVDSIYIGQLHMHVGSVHIDSMHVGQLCMHNEVMKNCTLYTSILTQIMSHIRIYVYLSNSSFRPSCFFQWNIDT